MQTDLVVTGLSDGAMRVDSAVLGTRSAGKAKYENRYEHCGDLIASEGRQLGKLEQDAKSVLLIQSGLRQTYSNRRQVPG